MKKTEPSHREAIAAILREYEEGWKGFLDVDGLAERIAQVVVQHRKVRTPNSKPPSEEFEDAVRRFGTCEITCELCDRLHFNRELLETGDASDAVRYEDLQKLAESNPEAYVENECGISWGYVEGKQAVIGCPCNLLRQYEDFIWSHRQIVADYFVARLKRMAKDLDREKNLLRPILYGKHLDDVEDTNEQKQQD